jgi:glutathione S-transferase
MITLYGMPKTRATRIVWALEEIGADYRFIPVDLARGEGQCPEPGRQDPGAGRR